MKGTQPVGIPLPGEEVPGQRVPGVAAAPVEAVEGKEGGPVFADHPVGGKKHGQGIEDLELAPLEPIVPVSVKRPEKAQAGPRAGKELLLVPEKKVQQGGPAPFQSGILPGFEFEERPEVPALAVAGAGLMGVERHPAVDPALLAAALHQKRPEITGFGVPGTGIRFTGIPEKGPEVGLALEAGPGFPGVKGKDSETLIGDRFVQLVAVVIVERPEGSGMDVIILPLEAAVEWPETKPPAARSVKHLHKRIRDVGPDLVVLPGPHKERPEGKADLVAPEPVFEGSPQRPEGLVGGLRAGPTLLEPIMMVDIATPDEFIGDLVGDLSRRRGKVHNMRRYRKGSQKIEAEAPLMELFGYATAVRSLSSGRANHSMEMKQFSPLPDVLMEEVMKERRKG